MMIDIHTHVLPKIDDGAGNWDVALDMLAMSAKAGVQKVIATPHHIPWKENASPEKIRELCREAEKKFAKKHGISLDIYPGNEIYYSLDVIQKLKEGKVLTLAGSRYVLVEFGTASSYQVFRRAVKSFVDSGYIPIIAHMERYDCLNSQERLRELKEMGALLQMNMEAFQGGLMSVLSHRSKRCLTCGLVDFLGSDMHDTERRKPLQEKQLSWIHRKLDSEYQSDIMFKNAQKVLEDIRI